jgi:hypothetical protein
VISGHGGLGCELEPEGFSVLFLFQRHHEPFLNALEPPKDVAQKPQFRAQAFRRIAVHLVLLRDIPPQGFSVGGEDFMVRGLLLDLQKIGGMKWSRPAAGSDLTASPIMAMDLVMISRSYFKVRPERVP